MALYWENALSETGMATSTQRSDKLDIRISPEAKRILQEAARARHTTISQFVIDSAIAAASEVLAERNRIGLNSDQWTAFMAALDAPPRIHERMRRLLTEPSILD
jgi:uncharacterized protein (DUF1778 family)